MKIQNNILIGLDEKVDVFVTGEASHGVYHTAKEAKVNVIFAGHYGLTAK